MTKRRPDRLWLGAILAICVASYLPTLDRGFVSEDFPTLGYLSRMSLGEVAVSEATGPWLDVDIVHFYRPLASILLRLELATWSVASLPFAVSHLLLHLTNVLLVYWLIGGLVARTDAALGGAAMFALYPLSPNAVSFVGAFPALAACCGILAGLLLFLTWVRTGRVASLAGALLSTAAALACYEVAVVAPVLAAAIAFVPSAPFGQPERRRGGIGVLSMALLVGAYFLARWAALGVVVGGYRQAMETSWSTHLSRLRLDWSAFLVPFSLARHPAALSLATAVAVILVTVVAFRRRRTGGRPWLLGVIWIFVAQAPFQVYRAVPGEGRYWYLAAAGLGLLLAGGVVVVPGSRGRRRLWLLPAVLTSAYLPLLNENVRAYRDAGRRADEVRATISRTAAASRSEPPRIFLVGYPQFLPESPPPRAQVFHWGLGDAFKQPFVERELSVYPVRPGLERSLRLLLERPEIGAVWRWSGTTVRPLKVPPGRTVENLDVMLVERAPARFSARFVARQGHRYRLVLLAPLVAASPRLDTPAQGGPVEHDLPTPFVRTMRRHYEDPIVWWVEERQAWGGKIARSSNPALLPGRPGGRSASAVGPAEMSVRQ